MKPKPTHLTIRSALRNRTRREHRSPYLWVLALALAGALPSFASTLIVQNTNDSGAGSLRDAIATAASGDTIQFSPSVTGTITLASELSICNGQTLTISGPGASKLTVSGNGSVRVFNICGNANVTISDLTIEKGNGNVGGGIFADSGTTLTVMNSTFTGNSADGGGGIYNSGTLTVVNSTFSGNSAPGGGSGGNGGGIANFLGTVTVSDSTLSNNSANGGAGIYNQDGSFTLTNSTLSGNSANQGAAVNNNSGGKLVIVNSTIAGNSAPEGEGGGIYNFDAVTLKNTLLGSNGGGGNCEGLLPFTSAGYNLSDDTSCNTFTQPTDKNNTPAHLDPKGLQNNGGPTQTVALLPTSPAVDAIPAADCTDANGKPVTTDQRGITRPQGKGCDIGAYELVQTVPFSNFTAYLLINTGKHHPGFALNSDFALGSASTGLQPASEAMTLQIANYTLNLPAGSFHPLWNAPNAPYVYEGTINRAKLVLGLIPLGKNQFQFDAAGSPVTFPGLKNPVTVSLRFGNDSGTTAAHAVIATY